MQLNFLNNLNEEQIIALINYINSEEEYIPITKQVQIFGEPDRCDENNNQEILVDAWNNNFHIGTYAIQDFNMVNIHTKKYSSKRLMEYMTSIFGDAYLEGLREYYAILAENEITRIKSTLGVGRS